MANPSDDRTGAGPSTSDPRELLRSKEYRRLLVFAGILGVLVSFGCWVFLELTHWLQQGVYEDLPDALGFSKVPWWWPLPVLAIAGAVIGLAIDRLPGEGGHEPSEGLKTGEPTTERELPGVLIAAIASVGLGLVLGPEAPLIALGSGLTFLLLSMVRRGVPDQAKLVLVAAAGFAALATIFGSPVVGAIIIIEAAGLGGARLPLVLLPGLVAAGIGSLVFVGVGSLTGLSTSDYSIAPLSLPAYPEPTVGDFIWTVVFAALAAAVVFVIIRAARWIAAVVAGRRVPLTVAAAVVIAVLAIAFADITGEGAGAVLFSGQDAMNGLVSDAGSLSLGVLALLLVCKALAWAISLGSARGGPTFPAIFLGVVGGLLAAHVPGFAETPAVGVLVGAAVVAVLRLPLSAVVLGLLVTQGGVAVAPLLIVGVVVAYIVTLTLDAGRSSLPATASGSDPGAKGN